MSAVAYQAGREGDVIERVWRPATKEATGLQYAIDLLAKRRNVIDVFEDKVADDQVYRRVAQGDDAVANDDVAGRRRIAQNLVVDVCANELRNLASDVAQLPVNGVLILGEPRTRPAPRSRTQESEPSKVLIRA